MHIEEIIGKIRPLNENCVRLAQERFDALIKPIGSLAKLEKMTTRYAGIIEKYKKEELEYPKKVLLVWCGIEQAQAAEKVLRGQWPVNVLAQSVGAKVHTLLVTAASLTEALEEGSDLVQEIASKEECDVLAFGCLADSKNAVVQAAMAGGMLQAAALRVPVILDGVATSAAAGKAIQLAEGVKEFFMAGHVSDEEGAEAELAKLGLDAPLRLNIPSGAGEGAVIAMSLLDAGIRAYKDMETFEEAGVHDEVKDFSRKEEKQGSHWQQEC